MSLDPVTRFLTDTVAAFRRHADRPALLYGNRVWTFGEVLSDTYRLAAALTAAGLGRGDGLVVLAGNVPELVPLRLAAHLLGLRFTAVHLGATTEALPHILRDADPAAVVSEPGRPCPAGPVPAPARAAGVRRVFSLGPAADATDLIAEAARHPDDPVEPAARPDDIAKLTYTSGTSGLPKGVPTTFEAFRAGAEANTGKAEAPPPDLRFLAVTPFAHVSGDIALLMMRFGVAAELHDEFDAGAVLAAISRATALATYLYPSLLYRLLDHPALPDTDTRALGMVIYGSAPISPSRLREAMDRFGPVFAQGYASTEAPAITALTVEDHRAGLARPELLSSAGRPLPGVEVVIRDERDRAVATGEVGEVCVRSASVMSGYWRNPGLTAEVLRDGWLHTGDLGRLDADGYLYLVGRARDMIIVNGHNCYAVPIEAALTAHPAVRRAAVTGEPDERTGEAVHAYVVADPAEVTADELRAWVGERLGPAHVPAIVTFRAELPLSTNGKPNRKALSPGTPAGTPPAGAAAGAHRGGAPR